MSHYKVHYSDGTSIDVDVAEFEPDGIGAILDHLIHEHGKIIGFEAVDHDNRVTNDNQRS